MKSESEDYRPNGGFWHGLNNLLTALAILWLLWSLLEFLWKRKSTVWLATALRILLPTWIGAGVFVSGIYWIVTGKYLTSDLGFEVVSMYRPLTAPFNVPVLDLTGRCATGGDNGLGYVARCLHRFVARGKTCGVVAEGLGALLPCCIWSQM